MVRLIRTGREERELNRLTAQAAMGSNGSTILLLECVLRAKKKVVTREDIKRFAPESDPQPYHLDEAAAEGTTFKGLAAWGWHTAAIAMRLAVEVGPFGPHPLLGLGVDELRWLAPVPM